MSSVFLLSSNTTVEPYPVYPLGMAVVAAALEARGHRVYQFDFLAEDRSENRLRETLAAFAPDFVGISLRNIDNVDSFTSESAWYLKAAKGLVEIVRAHTDVPIILGGAAFSILPHDILDYLGADYGVVGEGERAICDMVQHVTEGRFVPRILNGGRQPLRGKEMGSPRFNTALVNYYIRQSGMVNIQTKRGCPHQCLYCTYPSLEGNRFRIRKPADVVDDIVQMKDRYQVDTIFFADSVFNDAAGHYLAVAEELLAREVDIRWSGFFRPQGIRRQELAQLKRSGLYAMEVGTDAACAATLAGLNKRFAFADVLQFNRVCVEEEIPCAHFIMFGGPDETAATVQEGLDNIAKLRKSIVFAFSGIRILPRTGLHARAVAENVVTAKTALLKPVYYFSPQIDPQRMNAAIEKAFHGRRDRIFPPSEARLRMETLNRFGYRGLLWDQLISFSRKGARGR